MDDNQIDNTGMEDGADTAAMPPESNADAMEAAPEGDGTLRADEVKWRQRFRETEANLIIESARTADMADRITKMQTAEAQRLAAVTLEDPTDLWRDGTTVADLLGDDGLIDQGKVAEAAQQTVEAHPHWKRATPVMGAPSSAVNSDGRIPSGTTTPTWEDVFRGNKTG